MITYSLRDQAVLDFARAISNSLPIERVYLFGSTSRKDDRLDSDIDIAIIGYSEQSDLRVKDEINKVATEFLITQGILVNWIYFSPQDWNKNSIPIVKVIKKEGILIWAKEKTKSQ